MWLVELLDKLVDYRGIKITDIQRSYDKWPQYNTLELFHVTWALAMEREVWKRKEAIPNFVWYSRM